MLVLASFFTGEVSKNLKQWLSEGKRKSEEELRKELAAVITSVSQAENS